MITAGIDAGSRQIKVLLFDGETKSVLARGMTDQGVEQERLAREVFEGLCGEIQISPRNVAQVNATGYGRHLISTADKTITEITCHARGVLHSLPGTRTIIEVGGQDNKVIRLGLDGTVHDFNMNDRCAAGTGCFLELASKRLQVPLEEMGLLVSQSRDPAMISSMCAVFAETEIINLLATGTPVRDILAGVQNAVARRIGAMMGNRVNTPVVLTGGGALIPGMANALAGELKTEISVCPDPQFTGALGAALVAANGFM